METRALPITKQKTEEKKSPFSFFLTPSPLLISPFDLAQNQTNLFPVNGNGKIVNIKNIGVNEKTNGKILSIRDWKEMWNYIINSSFVRQEIKRKHGYITGIPVEDLVRDAYVVGMEELKKCRENHYCKECKSIGCAIWEKKFQFSFRKTLRKLQDLGKRNGKVDYLELAKEEEGGEKLPTTYRKDWDLSANWKLDPLTILCSQEEEKEKKEKEKIRLTKIKEALTKLKKKEREVWELLLSGMSPHEVATALGYKKVQGVYMVIRRSARKLRKLVRES
jgi:DNA-directed RNA polymerase specialized sigma24 family protein